MMKATLFLLLAGTTVLGTGCASTGGVTNDVSRRPANEEQFQLRLQAMPVELRSLRLSMIELKATLEKRCTQDPIFSQWLGKTSSNEDERWSFLASRMNRPFYFVAEPNSPFLRGSRKDVEEFACLYSMLKGADFFAADAKPLNADAISRVLRLPNINDPVLDAMISEWKAGASENPTPMITLLRHPNANLTVVLNAVRSWRTERVPVVKLALELFQTPVYDANRALLLPDLLEALRRSSPEPEERLAIFFALAQQREPTFDANAQVNLLLMGRTPDYDVSEVYRQTARLDPDVRFGILLSLLESEVAFHEASQAVMQAWSVKEQRSALMKTVVNSSRARARVDGNLRRRILHASLNEPELRSQAALWAQDLIYNESSTAPAAERLIYLKNLCQDKPPDASTAVIRLQLVDRLISTTPEGLNALANCAETSAAAFTDDSQLQDSYQSFLWRLPEGSLRFSMTARLLRRSVLKGSLMQQTIEDALIIKTPQAYSVLEAILKHSPVTSNELYMITGKLQQRMGKLSPEERKLTELIEKHAAADARVHRELGIARTGKLPFMDSSTFDKLLKTK